jgi:hypothetical protein
MDTRVDVPRLATALTGSLSALGRHLRARHCAIEHWLRMHQASLG